MTATNANEPAEDDEPDIANVEAVYLTYGRRCYSLALHVVRDPYLAQDVVQEVFALVCRQPERFDPARGSLAAWLSAVTHHKAVDLVRYHQRRTTLDAGDSPLANLPDPGRGPEHTACAIDEGRRIRVALTKLKATERDVITLAYYGGDTQRTIARRLGIPLGTVKSRTVSGMRHLRDALTAG